MGRRSPRRRNLREWCPPVAPSALRACNGSSESELAVSDNCRRLDTPTWGSARVRGSREAGLGEWVACARGMQMRAKHCETGWSDHRERGRRTAIRGKQRNRKVREALPFLGVLWEAMPRVPGSVWGIPWPNGRGND